jgi:lysozyme
MVSIVEMLAKLLTSKIGKIAGLVALGVAITLFVLSMNHRRSRMSEIPVLSLLEKVKFMERLDLVSFKTNETLLLGDPDVLEKMMEKAVADSSKYWKNLSKLSLELERQQVEKSMVVHSQNSFENELILSQKQVAKLKEQYLTVKGDFSHFKRTLKALDAKSITQTFGKDIEREWSRYRKNPKNNKKTIKESWIKLKKERFAVWEDASKLLGDKQVDFKHSTTQRKIRHLDKTLANLKSKVQDTEKNLKASRDKTQRLKKVILDSKSISEGSLNTKKPKLLAIVSCKVNVYLDLEEVEIKLLKDSTVLINVDSIQYDKAEVLVDSSISYNVSKRSIDISKEKGGLYLDVFEQLQLGTEIIAHKVESKAKSNHLKQIARKKADKYFNQLFNVFGHKVVVTYGALKKEKKKKEKIEVIEKPKTTPEKSTPKKNKKPVALKESVSDTIYGIDVSHFNGVIDWKMVATQKIEFAYAKATQGSGFTDPKFSINWKEIKDASMKRGAYHFYIPTDDPKKQAQYFIQTVGELDENDLPPMLDLEEVDMGAVDKETFQDNILIWLSIIEDHYKMKPIMYTYTSYANTYLANEKFSSYKLWIAEYTDAPSPIIPTIWDKQSWYIWQYSAKDKLKGINGYVDHDMRLR